MCPKIRCKSGFTGKWQSIRPGLIPTIWPAADSLETLYHRTCRLNRLFIALNRSWVSGCGDIQKACAYYLVHAGLSPKSRDAFIHVQGDIAYTICHLAACSDFISQMQRFFWNQEKELKQLLDSQKETEQQKKPEIC